MPTEEALAEIRVLVAAQHASSVQLEDAVSRARKGGASWERIAEALGIKRQSAMSRFAKVVADA